MGEELFTMDSILDSNEIDNLFVDDTSQEKNGEGNSNKTTQTSAEESEKQTKQEKQETKTVETTEVNVDTLFTKQPESVGSEENQSEKEDTNSNVAGSSQKNFYSSITKALIDEGIFQDSEENSYKNVKSPEDFRDYIEKRIKSELDERQQRIDNALNYGVEPSVIQRYENTIKTLDSITEEMVRAEDDRGENIRKQLIFQDYINSGKYSDPERLKEYATRMTERALKNGTDVDDAIEALKSNKEYFSNAYENLIKDAEEEENKQREEVRKKSEALKKSILEDKNVFGEIEVDNNTRKKVYETISKPVYKDPESGRQLTAIQKYEMENPTEFMKNVGLLFTLTDGFKNLNGLIKQKVRKEVNKGLRELENTLSNTQRNSDGTLNFVGGGINDNDSVFGRDWDLAI